MNEYYPDDARKLKFFLIDKGLFTEDDISIYVDKCKKEAEEIISKQVEERKAQEKAEEEERQKKREKKKKEQEKELKEIYPKADDIIADKKKANLFEFGSWFWLFDWFILVILKVETSVTLITWTGWLIFLIYSNRVKPDSNELKLARQSKQWVKKEELQQFLNNRRLDVGGQE